MLNNIILLLGNFFGFKQQKEKNIIADEVIKRLQFLEAYYEYSQNKISDVSERTERLIKILDGVTMPKNTKDLLGRKLEALNRKMENILAK